LSVKKHCGTSSDCFCKKHGLHSQYIN
jgi:hypothetical protein